MVHLKEEHLPFSIWTRTVIGLAFDGAHVYDPESLCMAFWTSRRLVVRRPFSVTNDIPPRGESKFITYVCWAINVLSVCVCVAEEENKKEKDVWEKQIH